MPYSVRCKACSTTFAIPDEIWNKRVKGHVATLKCRSCKADIEVDGTKPHISQFPSAPANAIPSSPTTAAADRTATVPKETTKNQPQLQSTVGAGSAAKASASSKATQPARPAASVSAAQPAGAAAVSNASSNTSQASAAASVSSKTGQIGGAASGAASGVVSATAPEIASANASSSVVAKPPSVAESPAAKPPSVAESPAAKPPTVAESPAAKPPTVAESPAAKPPTVAESPAAKSPTVAESPAAKSATVAESPAAKSAQEIAAADTGWSLVPPPAELARIGIDAPTKAEPEKSAPTKTDDLASADVGWSLAPPPAELARVGINAPTAEGVTSKTNAAGATASTSSARTQPSPTLSAAKVVAPAPASAPKASPEPSADVVSSAAPIEPTPEPDLNDLWVVSYGDDDDRELTEEQIASELGAGKITLSTIVWHDGMPEWLPISGIPQLSKYAPAPKPSPVRAKSSALPKTPSRIASSPTASLTPKLPSAATSNKLTPAASGTSATSGPSPSGARSTLQKPEAPPPPLSAVPKAKPIPAEVPETNVAEIPAPAESQAKQPPPLPKSTTGNKPVARDPKVLDDEVTVIYRPSLKSTGGHPPALPRRERPQTSPETPWEAAQNADEVVTSAPRVAAVDDGPSRIAPAVASTASVVSTPGFPVPSAVPRKVEGGPPRVAGPSAKPSPIKSSPPPKPVETLTSTVTHTEGSSNVNTQLINDAEFLAMQRRLPKWAVPTAVAGAVVLIGLLIWAFSSGEEPPAVTVTPVVPVAPIVTEKPTDTSRQSEVRAPAGPTSSAPTLTPGNSSEKDFARLFAQSVAKATGRFDAKAAERIATSAVDAAARCRHAPEPAGQARAVVTFATSGQVLSVQMGAPYINNSPTGKCIETALGTIKLPPFQGQPGRLSLTVAVR